VAHYFEHGAAYILIFPFSKTREHVSLMLSLAARRYGSCGGHVSSLLNTVTCAHSSVTSIALYSKLPHDNGYVMSFGEEVVFERAPLCCTSLTL